MSPHRLFRIPTVRTVPLRSSRPLLHHRRHRCGLGVARLEDRTLLSGPSGDVLAAVAPKIELGTPTTGTLAPGEVAFFQIKPNTDGRLVARVHAEGATTRLSLLDGQGQVLMQSDGQSPDNRDDQIGLHVPAGTDYLEVENLGGTGAYTLTTTLTPATTPFQPISVGSFPVAIVAGDFNGDGQTDLAVANYGSNDVSVPPATSTRSSSWHRRTPMPSVVAGPGASTPRPARGRCQRCRAVSPARPEELENRVQRRAHLRPCGRCPGRRIPQDRAARGPHRGAIPRSLRRPRASRSGTRTGRAAIYPLARDNHDRPDAPTHSKAVEIAREAQVLATVTGASLVGPRQTVVFSSQLQSRAG